MSKFSVYLPYEINVLEDLKKEFGDRFIHNDRYATYDFTTDDNEVYIEVKNLECPYDKYENIPIGFNKIDYAVYMLDNDNAKRFIVIFNYINDNKRVFYEFSKRDLKRFRISPIRLLGGTPKLHFWIPRRETQNFDKLII